MKAKQASRKRLACLVDQTPKFSNLLEDLRQVFIKSVDAQSSTISQ